MGIRINSGKFRGKLLATSNQAKELRPTQSLMRDALISSLRSNYFSDFADVDVLDLFAGIGSVSFELLSHGARSATLVEYDPKCIQAIKKNILSFGLSDSVTLLRRNVFQFLEGPARKKYKFVFADPPYKMSVEDLTSILEKLVSKGFLEEGAVLVFETESVIPLSRSFDVGLESLELVKKKNYGDSCFWFMERATR